MKHRENKVRRTLEDGSYQFGTLIRVMPRARLLVGWDDGEVSCVKWGGHHVDGFDLAYQVGT